MYKRLNVWGIYLVPEPDPLTMSALSLPSAPNRSSLSVPCTAAPGPEIRTGTRQRCESESSAIVTGHWSRSSAGIRVSPADTRTRPRTTTWVVDGHGRKTAEDYNFSV